MKKVRYSKLIVALVILLNAVFTMGVLYVFLKVGQEPTTLIVSWFAFTTTELLAIAGIKVKKGKTNDKTTMDSQVNEP